MGNKTSSTSHSSLLLSTLSLPRCDDSHCINELYCSIFATQAHFSAITNTKRHLYDDLSAAKWIIDNQNNNQSPVKPDMMMSRLQYGINNDRLTHEIPPLWTTHLIIPYDYDIWNNGITNEQVLLMLGDKDDRINTKEITTPPQTIQTTQTTQTTSPSTQNASGIDYRTMYTTVVQQSGRNPPIFEAIPPPFARKVQASLQTSFDQLLISFPTPPYLHPTLKSLLYPITLPLDSLQSNNVIGMAHIHTDGAQKKEVFNQNNTTSPFFRLSYHRDLSTSLLPSSPCRNIEPIGCFIVVIDFDDVESVEKGRLFLNQIVTAFISGSPIDLKNVPVFLFFYNAHLDRFEIGGGGDGIDDRGDNEVDDVPSTSSHESPHPSISELSRQLHVNQNTIRSTLYLMERMYGTDEYLNTNRGINVNNNINQPSDALTTTQPISKYSHKSHHNSNSASHQFGIHSYKDTRENLISPTVIISTLRLLGWSSEKIIISHLINDEKDNTPTPPTLQSPNHNSSCFTSAIPPQQVENPLKRAVRESIFSNISLILQSNSPHLFIPSHHHPSSTTSPLSLIPRVRHRMIPAQYHYLPLPSVVFYNLKNDLFALISSWFAHRPITALYSYQPDESQRHDHERPWTTLSDGDLGNVGMITNINAIYPCQGSDEDHSTPPLKRASPTSNLKQSFSSHISKVLLRDFDQGLNINIFGNNIMNNIGGYYDQRTNNNANNNKSLIDAIPNINSLDDMNPSDYVKLFNTTKGHQSSDKIFSLSDPFGLRTKDFLHENESSTITNQSNNIHSTIPIPNSTKLECYVDYDNITKTHINPAPPMSYLSIADVGFMVNIIPTRCFSHSLQFVQAMAHIALSSPLTPSSLQSLNDNKLHSSTQNDNTHDNTNQNDTNQLDNDDYHLLMAPLGIGRGLPPSSRWISANPPPPSANSDITKLSAIWKKSYSDSQTSTDLDPTHNITQSEGERTKTTIVKPMGTRLNPITPHSLYNNQTLTISKPLYGVPPLKRDFSQWYIDYLVDLSLKQGIPRFMKRGLESIFSPISPDPSYYPNYTHKPHQANSTALFTEDLQPTLSITEQFYLEMPIYNVVLLYYPHSLHFSRYNGKPYSDAPDPYKAHPNEAHNPCLGLKLLLDEVADEGFDFLDENKEEKQSVCRDRIPFDHLVKQRFALKCYQDHWDEQLNAIKVRNGYNISDKVDITSSLMTDTRDLLSGEDVKSINLNKIKDFSAGLSQMSQEDLIKTPLTTAEAKILHFNTYVTTIVCTREELPSVKLWIERDGLRRKFSSMWRRGLKPL